MIEIIAFVLMAAGIYYILRGLTENPEFNEEYYYEPYERYEYRYNKEEKKVKKDVKGGGVILIGPIPIVFGESRYAVYALMLAILLMMLSILFILAARL